MTSYKIRIRNACLDCKILIEFVVGFDIIQSELKMSLIMQTR